MFVFDRSPFAVVIPLALLVAVVLWSDRGKPRSDPPLETQTATAASLPSRCLDSSAIVGKSKSSVRSTSPG